MPNTPVPFVFNPIGTRPPRSIRPLNLSIDKSPASRQPVPLGHGNQQNHFNRAQSFFGDTSIQPSWPHVGGVAAFPDNMSVKQMPSMGNRQRQLSNNDFTIAKQLPKRTKRSRSIDIDTCCTLPAPVPGAPPIVATQNESIIVTDSSDNMPDTVDEFPDDIMATICSNRSSSRKDDSTQKTSNISKLTSAPDDTIENHNAGTDDVFFDPNLGSKDAIAAIEGM
ncbi:hypothetical protein LPJ74_003450 [Coemansia sp. RSA 1843]|nr:hypothetical protein LPJ74_003450 [Coemansia sp. RSA 1843]